MGLPKREKEKLKRLKKKSLKRIPLRIPIAKPGKRHRSKKDYKRTKRVDYDE